MDYVEAFKNLRSNNKYGRKSPPKAVLLLTVIELYEQSILTDNEIYYDESLKSMFLKIWNKVFPKESLFHPDAYIPFWYLQNDSFWHIIPVRGKEDILSWMQDSDIKPSEAELKDSVEYAELDEDLFFLMTISSGRSSLKRTLLETYTQLSEDQIERMAECADNVVDYSLSAMDEYEQILSSKNSDETISDKESSTELEKRFKELSDDLQITLSYEYFSFLKNRRSERNMLREVCPNVFALYDCITNNPVHRTDISPSFAFIYENFLSDLKIALMSEDGSIDLIDKIEEALEILRGNNRVNEEGSTPIEESFIEDDVEERQIESPSYEKENFVDRLETEQIDDIDDLEIEQVILDRKGKVLYTVQPSPQKDTPKAQETESRKGQPWTKDEEERIEYFFRQGKDFKTIAEYTGRTEVAIKTRLAKLGLIKYSYGLEDFLTNVEKDADENNNESDYTIENSFSRCSILNKNGNRVFSAEGKLKYLNGQLYRLNLKVQCFTLKRMEFDGSIWLRGDKKIVAYSQTELYKVIDNSEDYIEYVEEIVDNPVFEECRLKVKGLWYDYKGNLLSDSLNINSGNENRSEKKRDIINIIKSPLYAVRKQAVIRALGLFRLPASIKDIVRTISRTAWGSTIKEDEVEDIINTIPDVKSSEGKYYLRNKRISF